MVQLQQKKEWDVTFPIAQLCRWFKYNFNTVEAQNILMKHLIKKITNRKISFIYTLVHLLFIFYSFEFYYFTINELCTL